jgi:plasmid stabilization system protein ParE
LSTCPKPGHRDPHWERTFGSRSSFPYILVYEHVPQSDTVTLLRVLHGRRNITTELLKRD